MRRRLLAFAVLFTLAVPAIAGVGTAGYVLYFEPFGEWATICARDEATGTTTCTADSPPPSLSGPPAVLLHVAETASGVFAVEVEFRANVAPGARAALRVDGNADYIALLDEGYVAHVDRNDVGRLVAEMLTGRTLTVRAAGFGSGAPPIYVGIPLGDFIDAFNRMRVNIRQYGVIRDPG
jgi:hypothetical protein